MGKPKVPIGRLEFIPKAQLAKVRFVCAWDACEASFAGDVPKGWTILLTYWASRHVVNLTDIPPRDWMRDAVLCPAHAGVRAPTQRPWPRPCPLTARRPGIAPRPSQAAGRAQPGNRAIGLA